MPGIVGASFIFQPRFKDEGEPVMLRMYVSTHHVVANGRTCPGLPMQVTVND